MGTEGAEEAEEADSRGSWMGGNWGDMIIKTGLSLPWKPFWKKNYGDKRSGRGTRGGGEGRLSGKGRSDRRGRSNYASAIGRDSGEKRTNVHHKVKSGIMETQNKYKNKIKILRPKQTNSRKKKKKNSFGGKPR
jgi:hypothetical protein